MHPRDCPIGSVQCGRVCLCGERPLMKVQPQPHWEPQDWRSHIEKLRLGRHRVAESEHPKRVHEVTGEDGNVSRCGQQQTWSGTHLTTGQATCATDTEPEK